MKKSYILLLIFSVVATCSTGQQWWRPVGSLHELWINAIDLEEADFHNKQQMIDVKQSTLEQDSSPIHYYLISDFEPKLLKNRKYPFFQNAGQFYYEKGSSYKIFVNPILHLSGGLENGRTLYQNTRGIEFKGNIGGERGVGFYSQITENQWQTPLGVDSFRNRNEVLPGQIWYKGFKGSAYDFIGARGYITFSPVKNFITAQFGNDVNFIGFGERSLILSDHAAPYLFLKLNSKFGKHIRYQNIFSRYLQYSPLLGNSLFTPKYGASHRISAKLGKRTVVGLSEMVVFSRNDSNQRGFDPVYLNPIIFLRAAEIDAGSNDNVLMAIDAKHHLPFNMMIYGQFVLDEFNINFIRQGNQWWGNKYGYQLGARWASSKKNQSSWAISTEYNRVRPFTYSHFNNTSSYSHFNQSLAHPLGSNFHEVFTRINWVPHLKLFRMRDALIFDLAISLSQKGVDSTGGLNNYGGDILKNNETRVSDFGNEHLQGRLVEAVLLDVSLSYRLGYSSFFDIQIQHRGGNAYIGKGTSVHLGYRLNTDFRKTQWY